MADYHLQRNARNLEAFASGLYSCTEVEEMVRYIILNHKLLLKGREGLVLKPSKVDFGKCRFTRFGKVKIENPGYYSSKRYYYTSFDARCPNHSTIQALENILKDGFSFDSKGNRIFSDASIGSTNFKEVHKGVLVKIAIRIPFGEYPMLDSFTSLAGEIEIPEIIDPYEYP